MTLKLLRSSGIPSVGQPILAAAGFQPASAGHEGSLIAQEPPERRLQARLPAPRLLLRMSSLRFLCALCVSALNSIPRLPREAPCPL